MVDSLISEIIDVNIILIFNIDDHSEIEDLIECNNNLECIEFNYLDIDESNRLSEYLGKKVKYKNNSKLSDIISSKTTYSKKRVGF